MRPLSNHSVACHYARINRLAWRGRLPRVEVYKLREIIFETKRKKKLFKNNTMGASGLHPERGTAVLFINWKEHLDNGQWLMTLLHEMTHIYRKVMGMKRLSCQKPKFQKMVFQAMLKMRWGLL